jgi:hypothetical protein
VTRQWDEGLGSGASPCGAFLMTWLWTVACSILHLLLGLLLVCLDKLNGTLIDDTGLESHNSWSQIEGTWHKKWRKGLLVDFWGLYLQYMALL